MALVTLALQAGAYAAPPFADRVMLNGKVLTVDARDSVAEALAIRDGRIVAVGSSEDITGLIGPDTEQLDLAGRTVTPGLLDSHAHFSQGGLLMLTNIDLSYPQVKSVGDVVSLVEQRAAERTSGQWITGRGWDEGKLLEQRYVYASDLEPVSPRQPVWLMHTMGHYGVANYLALALAGISRDTPDPPGGTIDRDEDGNPTGVLKESAMELVTGLIPEATPQQQRDALRLMAREFNSECMTGLKDPGIGAAVGYDFAAAQEAWNAYQDVLANGDLSVRVFALWRSPETLGQAKHLIRQIAPYSRPPHFGGSDRLISGGIKLFADGSGGARTAWMWADWNKNRTEQDESNRGYPAIDPDLLRELIVYYHDSGLHLGVHAIGDRAIDWVVASYALALMSNPRKDLRHSIIHANIPSELALNTMAALQRNFQAAYPEPQATFTWWIGDTYAGNFGIQRSQRLNPFRTFREKHIQWGGGSDFDVTPFAARYGIWASMMRQPALGIHGADAFGHDEAVDVRTALRSFTVWAAHQMFLDDVTGSIEVGKYADLAVWDTDLYSAQPEAIKNMQCQMTLLEGDIVWQRHEAAAAEPAQVLAHPQ